LPLFNRQREKSYRGRYTYARRVMSAFRQIIQMGKGTKPLWAIMPLRKNREAYDAYWAGLDGQTMRIE
jgi:hypothetical protein